MILTVWALLCRPDMYPTPTVSAASNSPGKRGGFGKMSRDVPRSAFQKQTRSNQGFFGFVVHQNALWWCGGLMLSRGPSD